MIRLGIKDSSWHWKLYEFLCMLWGMTPHLNSICGYSQTVFWVSVGSILISPIILLGWILLKIVRTSYKLLSKNKVGQKIIDVLDSNCGYHDKIEDISSKMNTHFAIMCLVSIIMVMAGIAMAVILCIGIPTAMYMFVTEILPQIPAWIAIVFLYIGWSIILIFSLIGISLTYIGIGITLAFNIIIEFLPFLAFWLGITSVSCAAAFIIIKIILSGKMKPFREYLVFKYNGFQEAYKDNKKRRLKVELDKSPTVNSNLPPSLLEKIFTKISDCAIVVINFFTGTFARVQGKNYTILGGMALFIETIKSLIGGICPLAELIKDEKKNDH